jgi:hypothetical protein
MHKAGKLLWFVVLVAMLGISLRAQQSSTEKPASPPVMQAPQPGPEMQRLNFLLGDWTMDGEYLKSPMTGNGAKQTGWYKAHLGPGGFSVIADFEADSTLDNEIGHELLTWDPKKDAYTTVTVGNGFPGAIVGTAKWEGDNLVVQTEFGTGAATMQLRAVYSHVGEKTVQIEESFQKGDAPYQLIWKATATKK